MQLQKITSPTNNWQNSMSDIAFLLMIFFILTTLWGTPHIIATNHGTNSVNVKSKDLITVNYDGQNLSINNAPLSIEELKNTLDTQKKYRINIEDEVPYQQMIDILQVFANANITNFELGQ